MSAIARFDVSTARTPPPWASYVPDRNTPFRLHNTKGQAKQAISYHGFEGLIFVWDGQQWEEVFRADSTQAGWTADEAAGRLKQL